MMVAELPDQELARLAALGACRVLDTPREAVYDAITQLAAQLCGVPIAIISLVDRDRLWFKSVEGWPGVSEIPRNNAFCDFAIRNSELLEVRDATRDPRFQGHQLVKRKPKLRFYAGVPLITARGYAIGTLCVLDVQPGALSAVQHAALKQLSEVVIRLLELRTADTPSERLEQVERHFRATFEQAAVGMAHTTVEGEFIEVNLKLCQILGYSRDELMRMTTLELSTSGDRGRNAVQYREVVEGKRERFAGEKQWVRKDGVVIWVNRTVSMAGEAGDPKSYLIQVIEDITERKEFEEIYRATVRQAPVGIIHNAIDGRILQVNAKFCEIVGYSEQELLALSNADIIHPDDRGRERTGLMKRLLAGNIPSFTTEKRFVRKDGQVILVRRTVSVVRDPAGDPLYLVRIVEDVTERAQAEERYRATFDHAPVGIMHSGLDRRILHVNSKLCEILGYSEDELLRMTTSDLLTEEYLGSDRENYWDAMVNGEMQTHSSERRYLRKDGSLVWAARTVSLVKDAKGSPLYFIRMIEDISARRHAEEDAAQERKLLQTLVDNLPDRIYVKDRQGRFLLQNAENVKAHGARSPEELLGKTIYDLYPREVAERIQAEDNSIFESGRQLVNRERATTDASGNSRWQLTSKVPLRDDAGNIVALVGVNRDITEQKLASQFLLDSEKRYHDLFDLTPLPIWVLDEESLKLVTANQAALDKYGYTLEEIQAKTVLDLQIEQDRESVASQLRQRDPTQPAKYLRRHVTKDGGVIMAEVTAKPFVFRGRPSRIILINDITDRLGVERALRESEEQFSQLANNIPQVFWISDASLKQTIYISPACEQMLGVRPEDLRANPRKLVEAVHPEDRVKLMNARKYAALGNYDEKYRIVRPDGTVRWVQDLAFPVRDADGKVYRVAGIAEDITQRKEAEEKLVYFAHYDGLTGLSNRVLFRDRLEQSMAQGRRRDWLVGVIMLDLDRFKIANDTLGHAAGDMLLKQVAVRLTDCVRPGDTVGRFSGDEFGIILSDLRNAGDVRLVAQKILNAFSEPFKLEASDIHVTASIGISMYPSDSDDCDTLIKYADTALHRAKDSGRNNFQFYTAEMNVRALHRLNLENNLRHAIERQEFLLHYQPKASLSSGLTTGLEALLRWQDPKSGLVSPVEFVPVLEETGLIIPVGEWVIGEVCAQIKRWEAADITPVPVAINLSGRQFLAQDLGSVVKRLLDKHGINPALIELEITESSLMVNTEEAVHTLEYLNSLGVSLAIDDFGTGYSSLSYLKRFPLDSLKIDRSFVRDITSDAEDAAITRAVISMAHSLGLKVVAEGVETEAQMSFLAANACDEIQGYYLARPLAVADCSKWLQQPLHITRPEIMSGMQVPTVLLVDDDDDVLVLIQRALSQDGYRILTAGNASEGFEVLSKHKVDVVISDHEMPGMSGVEFLQRVKSLYPETVRLMNSGHADFQTVADAVNKGAVFRFVSKNADHRQLRMEIREALASPGTVSRRGASHRPIADIQRG
jgi:diguanylate cyclase (GGDEF)-like protein/PAS domain S-box-containing protein